MWSYKQQQQQQQQQHLPQQGQQQQFKQGCFDASEALPRSLVQQLTCVAQVQQMTCVS
jgi:hypothetical protein